MKKIYMFGLIARVWVPLSLCCWGGYAIYVLIDDPDHDILLIPILFLVLALVIFLLTHSQYVKIDGKNDWITFHFSLKKEYDNMRKLSSIHSLRVEREEHSALIFKWVNYYDEEERIVYKLFRGGLLPEVQCKRINRQLAKAIKDIEAKKDKTN